MVKTYSDEEIRQILHALFLEKKKTNELAIAKDSLEEENSSLLAQVLSLKKQTQETKVVVERDKHRIEKLNVQILEREKKISDLQHFEINLKKSSEYRQELEQLLEKEHFCTQKLAEEKKKLEEKYTEYQLDSEKLQKEILLLKKQAEEYRLKTNQGQEEHQKTQMIIKSLTQDLQACEKKLILTEKNYADSQAEHKILIAQFEELKERVRTLQSELTESHRTNDHLKCLNETRQTQNELLTQELESKLQNFDNMEKEVHLIKQSLVRGLRDAKEIESHYQETIKEKTATLAKLIQSQHHIDKQREQYHLLQEKFEAALESTQKANMRLETFQQSIEEEHIKSVQMAENHSAEIEKLQTMIRAKEEALESYRHQMSDLRKGKDFIENELEDQRDMLKNKEAELIHAQQHFAKKVKEAAILEEKYEEQRKLALELQQSLTQNKIKIAELQTSLDLQMHQQKQVQDQLHEAMKSAETTQAKWEEKYFAIYEKWQAAEMRIRELEKIEEKQKHLQGLLSNLGTFFETKIEMPPPEKDIPSEKPKEPLKSGYNLFDRPKTPVKPKQNLLD